MVTLVTIVSIWRGCQDSLQWCVGCTEHWSMLRECVPLIGSAGPSQSPPPPLPPLLPLLPALLHPLLRGSWGSGICGPRLTVSVFCPTSLPTPSLGLTILEVACNMELPHGGEGWQQLRQGYLPPEFTASE